MESDWIVIDYSIRARLANQMKSKSNWGQSGLVYARLLVNADAEREMWAVFRLGQLLSTKKKN